MLLRDSVWVVFFKKLFLQVLELIFSSPQNSYCGGIAVQKEFNDSLATSN